MRFILIDYTPPGLLWPGKLYYLTTTTNFDMPRARNRWKKAALATAISLAVGSAYADAVSRSKFRLALDDKISSRPETPAPEADFNGRIAFNGLIQSHPDPLFVALEERYEALPPFTMAEEEIPGQLIAEASLRERMANRVQSFATGARRFVPKVSMAIRQDRIDKQLSGREDLTLATLNPTFEYERDGRKWNLKSTYDLLRKQYAGDRTGGDTDHSLGVDYTLKINRQSELNVAALVARTHDRQVRDPIEDFDSSVRFDDFRQDRSQIGVTYSRGSEEDRSRYNIYYIAENASSNSSEILGSGYNLNRNAVGGVYTWRARRQMALVAESRFQNFDYDLAFRDNDHFQALVGSDMVLGRRLRARLRAGYEGKDFDNGVASSSFSEPVWRGSLEWAIRRNTTVKLETAREVYELARTDRTVESGEFNVRDWIRTTWNENWSDRLTTTASYTYRETNVEGSDDFGESAHQMIVSAVYKLTDNIRFALDGAFTKQDSDIGNDFIRRTFTFRTDYSL